MNRIYTAFATAALFVSTPVASLGQTASDMRDDQLLGAIVQATDNSEAADLLGFMQEASRRGLSMFENPQRCEEGIPETGLMTNLLDRSPVSWAYRYQVWQMAIETGYCGCAFDLQSFPEFQNQMVNHNDELDRSDIQVFRDFWLALKPEPERSYRAFKNESCGR